MARRNLPICQRSATREPLAPLRRSPSNDADLSGSWLSGVDVEDDDSRARVYLDDVVPLRRELAGSTFVDVPLLAPILLGGVHLPPAIIHAGTLRRTLLETSQATRRGW
jgi:hypothetical protein